MLTAMGLWSAARSIGVPAVSSVADADARLVRALQILDREAALIAAAESERARARAERGRRG
jgi:hypothetical protein